MATSSDKVTRLEGELEFRTGRIVEAIDILDERLEKLEAKLDALIYVARLKDSEKACLNQEEERQEDLTDEGS